MRSSAGTLLLAATSLLLASTSLLTVVVLTACEPTDKGHKVKIKPAPQKVTINQDDGDHKISAVGRFKYGTTISPHGAGISCDWHVDVQSKGGEREVWHRGDQFDKISLPAEGVFLAVWLFSESCGKWERVK